MIDCNVQGTLEYVVCLIPPTHKRWACWCVWLWILDNTWNIHSISDGLSGALSATVNALLLSESFPLACQTQARWQHLILVSLSSSSSFSPQCTHYKSSDLVRCAWCALLNSFISFTIFSCQCRTRWQPGHIPGIERLLEPQGSNLFVPSSILQFGSPFAPDSCQPDPPLILIFLISYVQAGVTFPLCLDAKSVRN